jgi:hypothetical protein
MAGKKDSEFPRSAEENIEDKKTLYEQTEKKLDEVEELFNDEPQFKLPEEQNPPDHYEVPPQPKYGPPAIPILGRSWLYFLIFFLFFLFIFVITMVIFFLIF